MSGADYVDAMMRAPQSGTRGKLLLPGWTVGEWTKLLASTTVRPIRASEVALQLGAKGRDLFFIAQGSFEVGVTVVDGLSVSPLARIEAGSLIGEQSFFDGEPRSANVWAVTDGTLLRWEFEQYCRFAEEEPALARDVLFGIAQVMSSRLRLTTIRIRR